MAILEWSKMHEMWNTFHWNNIVFSEETKIELHSNERKFVTRPTGKRNDPHFYITKEVVWRSEYNALRINKK